MLSQNISSLNVKPRIIRVLKENIGEILHIPWFAKDFLTTTWKTHSIKENKLNINIQYYNVIYIIIIFYILIYNSINILYDSINI